MSDRICRLRLDCEDLNERNDAGEVSEKAGLEEEATTSESGEMVHGRCRDEGVSDEAHVLT